MNRYLKICKFTAASVFTSVLLMVVIGALPNQRPVFAARYPMGAKVLPEKSDKELLSEFKGPRPLMITLMPTLFENYLKKIKEAGCWDDPAVLLRIAVSVGQPFQGSYQLTLDTESESNINNLLYLISIRERRSQLAEPDLEEDLWLNKAYYALTVFPARAYSRFFSNVPVNGKNTEFIKFLNLLSEVADSARRALFWNSNHILNKYELEGDIAAEVLGRIDKKAGADSATALQAMRLALARRYSPEKKNELLLEALKSGYYMLAEELWDSLTTEDKADSAFKDVEKTRDLVIEYESLDADSRFTARRRRAMILFELGDMQSAEKMFKELLRENDRDVSVWTGLAKAVWNREAPDFSNTLDIINQADARINKVSAEFLEMKIGLKAVEIYTRMASSMSGPGKEWIGEVKKGLAEIERVNVQYRDFKPLMAGLIEITLDFLKWPTLQSEEGPCAAPFSMYYERVAEVLAKKPDHGQALLMEPPLAILAKGFPDAVPTLIKKLPDNLPGPFLVRLRMTRARLLLAAAWNLDDDKLLGAAAAELDKLEHEHLGVDNVQELEILRAQLWGIRSVNTNGEKAEFYARALAHHQRALSGASARQRPVLLNNLMFLYSRLGKTREMLEIRDRIEKLSVDRQAQTLLLAGSMWLDEKITSEKVASAIIAEPGSRAYAAIMILAGQMAGIQGDEEKKKDMWSNAVKNLDLCRDFPLCNSCYAPGPVFGAGEFQWALDYRSSMGLTIPLQIDMDFWLLSASSQSRNRGKDGWPTLEEVKAQLK